MRLNEGNVSKEVINFCDKFIKSKVFKLKATPKRVKDDVGAEFDVVTYDCGSAADYGDISDDKILSQIIDARNYTSTPVRKTSKGISKLFDPKNYRDPKKRADTVSIIAKITDAGAIEIQLLAQAKEFFNFS